MNVVYALWLKNMKKFLRNRAESLGTLIQPLLWLLLFSVGMSSFMTGAKGNFDYLSFVLPGMIGFTLVTACINGGTTWLDERMTGIVNTYLVAPISRVTPLVANMLTVVTKALLQSAVIIAVGVLLGAAVRVDLMNGLLSAVLILLFGIGFSGIALYFASKAPNSGAYHMVIFLFQMPLLFFSNALYATETLPVLLQIFVRLNPMTYLITGIRSLMITPSPHGLFDLGVQILVLSGFALLGTVIASNAYKKIIYQE